MDGQGHEERPVRRRRGKKRVVFQPPKKFAQPVRALWEQASEEEKQQAHRRCATMLEYWLGRITKEEVMERLELPALRVWQLSQMALSGMLAGLLRQPRSFGGKSMAIDPEEDPKKLKKRIRELEEKLALTEDLVRLLRDLPENRKALSEPSPRTRGRRGKKRTARKGGSTASGASSKETRGAAPGDEESPPDQEG
jgi:hypothetical protein